jgi:predicted mannosyl-3-phosphoglycerate phosphatase (HAD superfamily)
MPTPQDSLASELRAAVLANDHQKARRLSAEYTEALRQHWISLSPGQRAVSPIPKQSIELLNWAREMTILQQALTASHLAVVEKARRYQAARSTYLQSSTLGVAR